jgi:hypothetical protein
MFVSNGLARWTLSRGWLGRALSSDGPEPSSALPQCCMLIIDGQCAGRSAPLWVAAPASARLAGGSRRYRSRRIGAAQPIAPKVCS